MKLEFHLIFYINVTREEERQLNMTKFSVKILKVLDEKNATTAGNSMSTTQILECLPENERKSYSTIYRHLLSMEKQGFVKCGLNEGLASTYYIQESGELFLKSQY